MVSFPKQQIFIPIHDVFSFAGRKGDCYPLHPQRHSLHRGHSGSLSSFLPAWLPPTQRKSGGNHSLVRDLLWACLTSPVYNITRIHSLFFISQSPSIEWMSSRKSHALSICFVCYFFIWCLIDRTIHSLKNVHLPFDCGPSSVAALVKSVCRLLYGPAATVTPVNTYIADTILFPPGNVKDWK